LFFSNEVYLQNDERSIGVYYGLNEYFQGSNIIFKAKVNNSEIYRAKFNIGLNLSKFSGKKFYRFDLNYARGINSDLFRDIKIPLEKPVVTYGEFINIEFTVGKRKQLAKNLELLCGLGTNLRLGSEQFTMGIIQHEYWTEGRGHTIYRFDPGIHLNSKLIYRFSKRFSVFATLNFSSTLILVDKQRLIMSNEMYLYDNGSTIKPVRLDLSLRAGASFTIFK
jgi:hypothetical protein